MVKGRGGIDLLLLCGIGGSNAAAGGQNISASICAEDDLELQPGGV
jgi:hypothetical protein